MNYKNKVILISGATGGMGYEIAKQLSKEGCKLALFARREDKLKEMSKDLSNNITECIYKKCDVSNKKDIKEAVDFTVEKYGRIDVAILIAGILVANPIQKMESSPVVKSMETNFFGTIYFLEHLFPIMKKQKESTIAVTSTLPDRRGLAGWGAYGASKAAISWFVESIRAEAKQKYNIKVLTIKPGSVETPMIGEYPRPGSITAERAAKYILDGIRKGKLIIQFPIMQVVLVRAGDFFPSSLFDTVPVEMRKGEGYPEPDED